LPNNFFKSWAHCGSEANGPSWYDAVMSSQPFNPDIAPVYKALLKTTTNVKNAPVNYLTAQAVLRAEV